MSNWIPIDPKFGRFSSANKLFLDHVRALRRCSSRKLDIVAIHRIRTDFLNSILSIRQEIRPVLKAAGLVLSDLVEQGWKIKIRYNVVEVLSPENSPNDQMVEKELTRRQELIKRREQLSKSSVKDFIQSMERKSLFKGQFVSISSLMRDGGDLARQLTYDKWKWPLAIQCRATIC